MKRSQGRISIDEDNDISFFSQDPSHRLQNIVLKRVASPATSSDVDKSPSWGIDGYGWQRGSSSTNVEEFKSHKRRRVEEKTLDNDNSSVWDSEEPESSNSTSPKTTNQNENGHKFPAWDSEEEVVCIDLEEDDPASDGEEHINNKQNAGNMWHDWGNTPNNVIVIGDGDNDEIDFNAPVDKVPDKLSRHRNKRGKVADNNGSNLRRHQHPPHPTPKSNTTRPPTPQINSTTQASTTKSNNEAQRDTTTSSTTQPSTTPKPRNAQDITTQAVTRTSSNEAPQDTTTKSKNNASQGAVQLKVKLFALTLCSHCPIPSCEPVSVTKTLTPNDTMIIGRNDFTDWDQVITVRISREHMAFRCGSDQQLFVSTQSGNGVYLNGNKLNASECKLEPSDNLVILRCSHSLPQVLASIKVASGSKKTHEGPVGSTVSPQLATGDGKSPPSTYQSGNQSRNSFMKGIDFAFAGWNASRRLIDYLVHHGARYLPAQEQNWQLHLKNTRVTTLVVVYSTCFDKPSEYGWLFEALQNPFVRFLGSKSFLETCATKSSLLPALKDELFPLSSGGICIINDLEHLDTVYKIIKQDSEKGIRWEIHTSSTEILKKKLDRVVIKQLKLHQGNHFSSIITSALKLVYHMREKYRHVIIITSNKKLITEAASVHLPALDVEGFENFYKNQKVLRRFFPSLTWDERGKLTKKNS